MANTNDLLKLIEEEMIEDIAKINVSDSEVTLDIVKEWYIETEKLVRALANLLPATMAQPINQLRYAGHHIIKISPLSGDKPSEEEHSNIVEAYKHCKRAFFDSLDLYVYHLGDVFKTKLAVLPKSQEVDSLAVDIKKHLDSHIDYRANTNSRIEYYEKVNEYLHEGLTLIAKVDDLCRENGIHSSMLASHEQLIMDKEKAIAERDYYDSELNIKMAAQDRKITYWALGATALIVLSGLFQGYLTQKFVTPSSRAEITMFPVPVATNPATTKIATQSNNSKLPHNKQTLIETQKVEKSKSTINAKVKSKN